jgi:hypothetical protein
MQFNRMTWMIDPCSGTSTTPNSDIRLSAQILRTSRLIYLETQAILYELNVFAFDFFTEADNAMRFCSRVATFARTVGARNCNLIRRLAINCLDQLHTPDTSEPVATFPALRLVELFWTSQDGVGGAFRKFIQVEKASRPVILTLPITLPRTEVLEIIKASRQQTSTEDQKSRLDDMISLIRNWQAVFPTAEVVMSFKWLSWESVEFRRKWLRVRT